MGCVENAVIEEAQTIMRTGVPRTLTYGVADETAWELGLPCGGTIEILALKVSDRALIQRLAQPEPAVFIANTLTGLCAIFGEDTWQGTLPQDSILVETALPLLASGEVMITDHSGDTLLLRPFTHPYRLMIVGAVHIAQPLAEMARLTGFDVMIIDPTTRLRHD